MNKLRSLSILVLAALCTSITPAQDKADGTIGASIEVSKNGNVEFIIGGITDNVVGFLYSPTNEPPAMGLESYIWVEEMAPKWFIFRTT